MPSGPPSAPPRLDATTIAAESRPMAQRRSEPDVTVLVIACCPLEPERVGELAVLPASGSSQILGRGGDGDEPRMRFFRPRPGQLEAAAPLASPGLSRRQLEVRTGLGGVEVRRVGQCPMRVNGVECDSAFIQPGDTLRFRQELVLLCARRAARLAPLRHFDLAAAGRFGEADVAGILGESPSVWALRERIAFAAKASAHVLLVGESGTGKELAARAVHRFSARAGRPLVARNAATLPSGLIDAELFGNVRNYPNPGMTDRPGIIGQADGGFLFLDEIGELPAEMQSHLLRVLDAGGEYQRLGEANARRSDFRLLAATNRDPAELKHDLVARLTVRVEMPPLSERPEDIPLLMRHLILRASEKSPEVAARFVERRGEGAASVRVDTQLVDELLRRDYPGNTRELEGILWEAMGSSDGDILVGSGAAGSGPRASEPAPARSQPSSRPRNPDPSEDEIRQTLARENGHVARAANALGLSSRYALYRLMAKLGIEGETGD
jgi:DNA-binding NtrC family response regulator